MVGLQPALRSRWPRGAAAVADGVVLGAIHIGYWSHGPADLVAFVLTVGLVAAMSVLFQGSWWQRRAPDRGRDLGRGAARACRRRP
jgi:membrane protease YdiL (CAAX protease family)